MVDLFRKLPLELVEIIGDSCLYDDLDNLRFTSRHIYHSTLCVFGKEHYQSICTNLSAKSLRRLQAVVGNKHLAKYTKSLCISNMHSELGQGLDWGQEETIQQWTDLLKSLPNCRSFRINARTRNRRLLSAPDLTSSDALNVLLRMILEAGVKAVSFDVDIEGCSRLSSGRWSLNNLKQGHGINSCLPLSVPELLSSWSTLESLTLRSAMCGEVDFTYFLGAMAAASSTLRKLSIACCSFGTEGVDLLRGLSELPAPIHLQYLTIIRSHFWSSESLLIFLRSQSHSLRSLSLSQVTLHNAPWLPMFETISEIYTALEYIALCELYESSSSSSPETSVFCFPEVLKDPIVDVSAGGQSKDMFHSHRYEDRAWDYEDIYYNGRRMDLALQKIVDGAEVRPLEWWVVW
ncbi:hypothetical protein BJX99DRAFT_263575 [Aspergillus californicus]